MTHVRFGAAAIVGTLLHMVVNGVAIAVSVPWPTGGWVVRLAHHAVDVAQSAAWGGLIALATFAGAWLLRGRPWAALAVYSAAWGLVMTTLLDERLDRQADAAFDGFLSRPLYVAFVVGAAIAVPVAHVAADALARRRWWALIPIVLGLATMIVNHTVMRDDYEVVHVAVGLGAVVLAGAGVAPRLLDIATPWARRRPRLARGIAAGWLALAVSAILVAPPNRVRLEQFKEPVAIGAWALAMTLWHLPDTPVEPGDSDWYVDRSELPSVPPTAPPGPANPVVVLVTIDAFRAEVLEDPANDERFRTFGSLKRTGTFFRSARSPGSQTSVSLSTMFSGKYFSELHWGKFGEGSTRFLYPNADPTVRFPQLLADAGVRTVSFLGVNFLDDAFGIARGFTERTVIPEGRQHAMGSAVVSPMLEVLRQAGPEPMFVYAHLMEPHHPYNRGAVQDGPAYERYLSEIEVADREIGRIAKVLFAGPLRDRAFLFVASDHGEAFGEHDTWKHTKTLYEELLRVPLLVRGPGVARRGEDQPVSLIDVGPTVLDLFGVDTPAHFKGQSLVPLLRGQDVALSRPLFAEGRLRRVAIEGDMKVILDDRRKVIEAYDLAADPGETVNLYDSDPDRVAGQLGRMNAFFDVHAYRVDGYEPPYKP